MTIGGRVVPATVLPEPERYRLVAAKGKPTPPVFELHPSREAAEAFHAAISTHCEVNLHASSVDVHTAEEYAGMRLFATGDGLSGFAVKDVDELVSVFSHAGSGRGRALAAQAVAVGARRADCFAQPQYAGDISGFLPRMYIEGGGFCVVGVVAVNPDYGPPPDATHVAILAVMDDPPEEAVMFDRDGYDAACRYRDRLVHGHSWGL